MGILADLASAAVKTVALPLVIVADVATLGKNNLTKKQVEAIEDDVFGS
jgi:hypothetical protein